MNEAILDSLREVQALIDSLSPIPERIEVTPAVYQSLQALVIEQVREDDYFRLATGREPRTPALGIPIVVIDDLPEPYRIIWPGQEPLEDIESP